MSRRTMTGQMLDWAIAHRRDFPGLYEGMICT